MSVYVYIYIYRNVYVYIQKCYNVRVYIYIYIYSCWCISTTAKMPFATSGLRAHKIIGYLIRFICLYRSSLHNRFKYLGCSHDFDSQHFEPRVSKIPEQPIRVQSQFFVGAATRGVAEGECRSRRQRGGRGRGGSDRSLAQDMADEFAFSSASRPRSQDVGVSVSQGVQVLSSRSGYSLPGRWMPTVAVVTARWPYVVQRRVAVGPPDPGTRLQIGT